MPKNHRSAPGCGPPTHAEIEMGTMTGFAKKKAMTRVANNEKKIAGTIAAEMEETGS
ncbi:MAG: hypothetical protein WC497_02910 [Patescibacteria group bacterium]